ncbi:MAG: hypothetical protein Q7R69_02805 [bacterium]|nr:hypothetical protein [bacterium]
MSRLPKKAKKDASTTPPEQVDDYLTRGEDYADELEEFFREQRKRKEALPKN